MSEIPLVNRKQMPDGTQPVWPVEFEGVFTRAAATAHHVQRILPSCGFRKRLAVHRWIAVEYYQDTGLMRTPRQISSHLQQRRTWFKKMYGDEMSWDYCIGVQYGYIVEDEDYDQIGEDEADEPFELIELHEVDDHPGVAALLPGWACPATPSAAESDFTSAAFAAYIDGELATAFGGITMLPECDA